MICVMGDTHGDYTRFSHKKIKRLKKNDFLIICGDFGFVWDGSKQETAALKKIGSKPFTTLFITGGHDNSELLSNYEKESFLGGMARHICGRLYMPESGGIFDIDGHKAFFFGGGQSPDIDEMEDRKIYMPAEDELEQGRELIRQNGGKVDYIFTHEPPGEIAEFLNINTGTAGLTNYLNVFFDKIRNETEFKMWFFGKLHKNKLIPPRYAAVFDEPYIIE